MMGYEKLEEKTITEECVFEDDSTENDISEQTNNILRNEVKDNSTTENKTTIETKRGLNTNNIFKSKRKYWGFGLIVIGLFCLLLGVFYQKTAFDKKNKYYNSENYLTLNKNAYVGGDAYNYIINGTYFTAYATLATGMYAVAAITGTTGIKILVNNKDA